MQPSNAPRFVLTITVLNCMISAPGLRVFCIGLAFRFIMIPVILTKAIPSFRALELEARQSSTSISALSVAQISSFKPFSNFAAASYCSPDLTRSWSCGGTFCVVSFTLTNSLKFHTGLVGYLLISEMRCQCGFHTRCCWR